MTTNNIYIDIIDRMIEDLLRTQNVVTNKSSITHIGWQIKKLREARDEMIKAS